MANAWRGYRPLVLDGRRFRWACSFNDPLEVFSVGYAERGESWPPDRLVIRPEEGSHRRLTIRWPACRGPVITPGLVRACVVEAVRWGWPDDTAVLELVGAEVPQHSA